MESMNAAQKLRYTSQNKKSLPNERKRGIPRLVKETHDV